MVKWGLLIVAFLAARSHLAAQAGYEAVTEAEYRSPHFVFESGETLDTLRMHCYTLGTPIVDRQGKIINAILILHATLSASPGFLSNQFGEYLFGAGQSLDVRTYFIILSDGIGHG